MASDATMDNPLATEDVQSTAKLPVDIQSVKQKKYKADDLPLSAAQHAVIDRLLHAFKKKGGFDSVRKQIWADFNDGEPRADFTNKLIALAESEIDREPALLSRERGKAATLIEGAVDRGDVYKSVEQSIDQLASKHLDFILESVRDIRRQDVGEEVAARELELGNKTDADYEAHVRVRREEREKVWREEERKQREAEEEEKRIKDEERKKKRELERQKEEEERARRKEIDEQRRAERERQREEQRALDEQREREREERYERRRREDRERYRGWDRDRSRTRDRDRYRDRSPGYRSDRGLSPWPRDSKHDKSSASDAPTPVPAPPVDEKSLEEAALQMLLKEGEELAAKARQKPEFDFEEAEAIENGVKLPGSTSALGKGVNGSRYSTRAVSPSRDSEARRGSIADRHDRSQYSARDRSRSRSRRRRISRNATDRRRDRSRDTSVRSRDPDMEARRGYRDFRDDRGECETDRGRKTATAAAPEHMSNIALGAPDPLAHPYAGVHAAAPARVLGLGIGHDQVLDLREGDLGLDLCGGDLGLGVGRLHLHSTLTATCPPLVTGASHPDAGCDPQIETSDPDCLICTATNQHLNGIRI
ncbi:uncharacterized protein N7515_006753 [Penicillium bovifimosum]|uniref:BOD1/SHG1 domain-containing protein n=1 Tax=Penicillium bovifimosum TaxID=126998 RepID=A0A9W9L128_9EURO|nr:uncharacterized protein N7515_006753 [Penicillium bovifimosum]KAJ5130714.1 hypothetical protein N7515_006753 [Penicillium bovifimosum]